MEGGKGRQEAEGRRQKTEGRRQKAEDRRQKTEDRRQKTEETLIVEKGLAKGIHMRVILRQAAV
ncbi:MAG: hypothetical protein JW902_13915 [Syntrophaceae bacterium]|nr:hypothetical protein [Syntrophaceae bacterium]